MRRVKNVFSTLAVVASLALSAQSSNIPSHYATMYENQMGSKSASVEAVVLSAKEKVEINLNEMLTDPVLRNASWGFVVYDPTTRKIVNSYNENQALVPASTTKLLTTDTAMGLLGSAFQWITQLEYSGEITSDGTLEGNLHIVGSGDPSLGTGKAGASSYSAIVSDFVFRISELGIKKIQGDIVIQTGVFKENKVPTLPKNIVWLEHNNYYLPAGTTLNIDPTKEKLTISKKSPFEEKKQYFYISPYVNKLVFANEYSAQPLSTRLPDAPHYLANTLRTSLIKNGISVLGKVSARSTDPNPEPRVAITSYRSPKLKDIVYDTNQRSDNALAEALLRMVGFQKDGDQTLDSGRNVVRAYLESKNFDTSQLSFIDGSGLSRSHRVTPISQVKFLADQMDEKYFRDFFDSLPIAGQTGTLKNSFDGEGYGQIFAKTGTLRGVKTLAGYIKTRTGKTLAFSLLINNYSGSVDQVKNRMERILAPTLNL